MQLFWAVICLFAFAGAGLAQDSRFSFGVKGGFVLSDSDSYPRKGLDRYAVGPTIEARLWKHVAIETDALYKRLERAPVWAPYPEPAGAVTQPGWHYAVLYGTNTTSWEFPVLGKYYFGDQSRSLRIFAGAGFSLERSSATMIILPASYMFPSGSAAEPVATEGRSRTCPGATFTAGFTLKKGRLRLTPELRYTRWGDLPYQPGRNQPALLIGLSL
jgi:hypothetical protein